MNKVNIMSDFNDSCYLVNLNKSTGRNFYGFWDSDKKISNIQLTQIQLWAKSLIFFHKNANVFLYTKKKIIPDGLINIDKLTIIYVDNFEKLFKETPFVNYKIPSNLSKPELSDIIRLTLLYKNGGTWLDIDDIVVREFPNNKNILGTFLWKNKKKANYWGATFNLVDGSLVSNKYKDFGFHIQNDPMINWEKGNKFLYKWMENILKNKSADWGQKVPTEIIRLNKNIINECNVTLLPQHHLLLHPAFGSQAQFGNPNSKGPMFPPYDLRITGKVNYDDMITKEEFWEVVKQTLEKHDYCCVKNSKNTGIKQCNEGKDKRWFIGHLCDLNNIDNVLDKFKMYNKNLTNNFIYKICIDIQKKFNKYNIDFGNNLYKSVEKVTNKFTDNLNFFNLQGKIDEQYLDYILQEYCSYNKNIFLLIVWPVTYNHEKIFFDIYGKYGKILYKKEIPIKNMGFKNILHFISDKKNHPWGEKLWFAEPHRYINPLTIYVFETKNITEINNIEKKKYLIKIFNNNTNHINNIEKRGGLNNLYITTKAKRECREVLAKNNCVKEVRGLNNRNYSHHVNDEHYETVELSRIFFNKNSIFAINNCNINFKCKSFNEKYKRYVKFINNNKWGNIEDFCLNNSSILSQFGLRQSRDIDYLHNQAFEIAKQIPEPEISSHNYVVKSVNSNININELVYNPNNYFWYKNIKFCTLEKLLEFKKQQTTDKAKNDVKLCESRLLKQD